MQKFEDNTDSNIDRQDEFVQANPSPVLSSASDGRLQFINPATSKLLHDLGLELVEELLPKDHKSLVKACLNTGVTLTEECQLGGMNIVWSYRSTDKEGDVYIYGHDITAYQKKNRNLNDLPEENPNPVLVCNIEGKIQFSNAAVSFLLDKLSQEDVEEILPVNHLDIVDYCLKNRSPVSEERQTGKRSIVWSYQLPDDSEVIYIYGYDVTDYQPRGLGENSLSGVNPSPVLTSNLEGILQYFNQSAMQLSMDLGADNIEDMLPKNHKGMVKACHSTNTPLTKQHQVNGETLVWAYVPVDASDVIYIYGHDITGYC